MIIRFYYFLTVLAFGFALRLTTGLSSFLTDSGIAAGRPSGKSPILIAPVSTGGLSCSSSSTVIFLRPPRLVSFSFTSLRSLSVFPLRTRFGLTATGEVTTWSEPFFAPSESFLPLESSDLWGDLLFCLTRPPLRTSFGPDSRGLVEESLELFDSSDLLGDLIGFDSFLVILFLSSNCLSLGAARVLPVGLDCSVLQSMSSGLSSLSYKINKMLSSTNQIELSLGK